MEKENLKIEENVARGLAYGDYDESLYEIISNKIIDNSRWSVHFELIIKTISDNRFWKSYYSKGATEAQCEDPYEFSDPNFTEVFPKNVEIVIYE